MTHHIAFYGRSGVGKTTLAANISASMIEAGFDVILVGCDPKADSTSLLNNGFPVPNVLNQMRNKSTITGDSIVHTGFKGIRCVELGDPGYSDVFTYTGISCAIKEIKRLQLFEKIDSDFVLYDFSGDTSHAYSRQLSGGLDSRGSSWLQRLILKRCKRPMKHLVFWNSTMLRAMSRFQWAG